MNKFLFLIITIFLPLNLMGHEGHNDAPGTLKSLHGGTVQRGKELNLEVIINGREFILYPTSHENKDIPAGEVKITATAKPKKGKKYLVSLLSSKGGYSATVDLHGANRLPIEIDIKSRGKIDHFTIQIEE